MHHPPQALSLPYRGGTEARLQEFFGEDALSIQVQERFFVFRFLSAGHWLEFFRTYYGPTLTAFASLDDAGKEALANDLRQLANKYNRSNDDTMPVPSKYLGQ